MIVNLKVTSNVRFAVRFASTVSDSENDDGAFLDQSPVGSSQSMIGCKIKPIPNTNISSVSGENLVSTWKVFCKANLRTETPHIFFGKVKQ